ncbi:MAG: glycosyltransferase, partial [Candidatus Omnitrophota bacterium]
MNPALSMNSNGDRKKGGVKVLHVSTHMNIGGIGNYILSLSRATKARGIDVAVASSGGDLVVELEKSGIRHYGIDIRTKSELSPKVVKSVFALAKLIEKEGVDIVHAHTRVSQVAVFFASRMSGVPYISTCHGFFKTRFRKIFDTWGARAIAISDAVADHLRDDQGVSAERVEVIYSGIDAARFAREYSADEISGIKRSLGLRPGPVVGSIGRLSPVKGQRFLIEAMRGIVSEIGDAQALIVGNGPDENSLKELARSLGLENSICFTDAGLDTDKYLSAMDIFVFPSVKEGLGI